jgi:hypothetical protein
MLQCDRAAVLNPKSDRVRPFHANREWCGDRCAASRQNPAYARRNLYDVEVLGYRKDSPNLTGARGCRVYATLLLEC